MGSVLGVEKIAAHRVGLGWAAYRAMVRRGQKWCHGCKKWHSRAAFGLDISRSDGLNAVCRAKKNAKARDTYVPRRGA